AGHVSLSAATDTNITVIAKATEGGGSEPADDSETASYLADDKYGKQASTDDGKVSAVGPLAISDLTSTTRAACHPGISATIAGELRSASSSVNHVELSADGSSVDSKDGVGVTVGVNIANIKNGATTASAVSAGSIHLSA